MNFFLVREILSPLIVGVVCFVLGTHQQPAPHEPSEQDLAMINGCVVSACSYLAAVKAHHTLERDFWAKVLLVRFENHPAGHAYCVWETEGTVYGYDRNSGGFPLPSYTRDPHSIATVLAKELSKHLGETLTVASADFVEPGKAEMAPF